MIRKIIQLGQFQIWLVAHTPIAQACLMDFLSHLPGKICVIKKPSNEVRWVLHIIASEPMETGILDVSYKGQDLWKKVHKAGLNMGNSGMGSFFSIQSAFGQFETEFIHFISPDRTIEAERLVLIIHLTKIIQRYLMVNGNLSLHSSSMVRNKLGFLFLGQSGAGKSTVAILSKEKAKILHDEKILLTPHGSHYVLSRIPALNEIGEAEEKNLMIRNRSESSLGVHVLSGIFVLKQDTKDFLVTMPNLATAHALMQSLFELPRIFTLSRPELFHAMNILSKVAREIPAYELHFRKSSDFWKLIDERFPG
jgi:hypothetical protein